MIVQTGNEKIGKIREFCYIGIKITRDGRCNADIRSKVGKAKLVFAKISQLLVSNVDLAVRKKLLITYLHGKIFGRDAVAPNR